MRILLLTQNEGLYLPEAVGKVCRELGGEIVCVVALPALSTHGGAIGGALRHIGLFGLHGTTVLATKLAVSTLRGSLRRTRPDGPFYSVRGVCRALQVPYRTADKVNGPDVMRMVGEFAPDLLISMSCPQPIARELRMRFPSGCINVHSGPLPRYRGLMPSFWVLRNGENTTAVTVHELANGLDDGAILVQHGVPISPEDTWDSLVRKTKAAGAEALLDAVDGIKKGMVMRRANRHSEATYFSFPTAADRKALHRLGRRFF